MINVAWKAEPGGDAVNVTLTVGDHSGADGHTVRLEAGQKLRATWLDKGDARTTAVDVECVDPADPDAVVLGFHGDVTLGAVGAGRVELVSTSGWLEVGRLDAVANFSAHTGRLWRQAPGAGVRFPKVLRTPAHARLLARDFVEQEGPQHRSTVDRLPIAIDPPRAQERIDQEVG